MPVPSPDVFKRLAAHIAIPAEAQRDSSTVIEPFTGNTLATVPMGTAEDVEQAVRRARAAQKSWSQLPVTARAAVLNRYHDLVLERREQLIDMAQAETGKSRLAAAEEIMDVALTARYYARASAKLLAPKRRQGLFPGFTKTVVHHQPKGVVGVIAPWNYPLTLAVTDALAALMAGNGVVIKPDRQTPHTALAAIELLYEAGLPQDLYAVVTGAGSVVGTAIVENTDYLMFTGSTATGRTLAEQTGRRLIGFSAELGGKNPMIVTAGVDIPKVVNAAIRACFANSGQLCISIERLYVEQSIAEEFTRAFAERVRAVKLGAGYDYGPEMGSLASQDQLDTVSAQVQDALAKGATAVAGGKARPDLGPFFHEPTVLTGVTDEMDCGRNETFGPVVSIYPVADVEEAIERANDTEYGLNASVWAATRAQGEAIGARLRAGTVNVNEGYAAAWGSTDAPMGGMGTSGMGRRHGAEGLLKYTESQTVATQRLVPAAPPRGVSQKAYTSTVFALVKLMKHLPGR
ncbi:succinic semialdehyde dehydrogenase [Rhodococcus sp. X156]|uniref:succinic semialdehyde dehydrogenase n=1 Tax=Rhodococcus sp. X156 TaxID=2499145 RepID=UPI000FDAD5A6|nr:succinic semialdehyde dehydrogenase [Rhodococcus sp. X156]